LDVTVRQDPKPLLDNLRMVVQGEIVEA